MKKIIITSMMVLFGVMGAMSQNDSSSFYEKSLGERFFMDIKMKAASKDNSTNMVGVGAELGFEITPRLFATANYEGVWNMKEAGGARTWWQTNNIGGGLGYKFYLAKNEKSLLQSAALKASLLTSIGGVDWKQTVYEVGAELEGKGKYKPVIGFGYRHTNSRTTGLPDHNGFYMSIGLRF